MANEPETFPVRSGEDVVKARQVVRSRAMELGFSLVEQTKIVTAASELARNTVIYGGGGEMRIERVRAGAEAHRAAPHVRGPRPGHPRHRARAARRLYDRQRPRPRPERRAQAFARVRHPVRSRARARASRSRAGSNVQSLVDHRIEPDRAGTARGRRRWRRARASTRRMPGAPRWSRWKSAATWSSTAAAAS